jgi:glucan phosphoethanolaminetransferase (alkaline phosphatase superfamily)
MTQEMQSDELQSIWQSQPTVSFQIPLADIHHKAEKLQRQISWRNRREYIASFILIIFFGYIFRITSAPVPRLGIVLIIAGMIYAVYQLYRNGSARTVPPEMSASACIDFHIEELQRQYRLLRNVWSLYLRPFVPGMALYLVGMTIPAAISPGTRKLLVLLSFSGSALFMALVFYCIYRLNQNTADDVRDQIDALNAIKRN